jgi:hypothetical protein
MPTFLEPFYPAFAGILIGVATMGAKKVFEKINARKYAPMLSKVYDVVDPLLDQYYTGWSGSTIDTVLELAFYSVGDGHLSTEEAQRAVQMAKEKFLPDVAKSKRLDPNTPEGRKSLEIAEMVLKMEDGVDRNKMIDLAKASIPLTPVHSFLGLS